jgi:DNA-binding Lrp family transcriptional regulator
VSQGEFEGEPEAAALIAPRVPVLRAVPGGPPLDAVERALVDLLQEDGRTSYAELGRRLGVTERTARRKVGGLSERGIVQVAAVTDPEVLGYSAMALLGITVSGAASSGDLAERFADLPEVDYVVATSGRFALQVEVLCRDGAALRRFVDESVRTLPGVEGVDVLPYLRLHYQQARFDADRRATAGIRPTTLDAADRAIVTELALDGRAPFSDVAARLGVSETMVRQRFARLTGSGVVKVMALVNPLSRGFAGTAWLSIVVGPGGQAAQIAERLTQVPEIHYVAITAGRCDVLAEANCLDREELLTFVDGTVRTLGGVAQVEVSLYLDLLYKPLLPAHAEP